MVRVNRDIAINFGLLVLGAGLVATAGAHAPVAPTGLRRAVELMIKRAATQDLRLAHREASADALQPTPL